MSLKYEKPIVIPFTSQEDEKGIGQAPCSLGSGVAGNCQDGIGPGSGKKCQQGTAVGP
jgi:SynChlorMet cassette protein ScmA